MKRKLRAHRTLRRLPRWQPSTQRRLLEPWKRETLPISHRVVTAMYAGPATGDSKSSSSSKEEKKKRPKKDEEEEQEETEEKKKSKKLKPTKSRGTRMVDSEGEVIPHAPPSPLPPPTEETESQKAKKKLWHCPCKRSWHECALHSPIGKLHDVLTGQKRKQKATASNPRKKSTLTQLETLEPNRLASRAIMGPTLQARFPHLVGSQSSSSHCRPLASRYQNQHPQ